MFETAAGVSIPFPEHIKEEYQIFKHSVRLNLSFEKIKPMLLEFVEQLEEPLFFVLQLPLTQQEEAELRKNGNDLLHQKVCYLDGQSKSQIMEIISNYGELLLNDGISQFAVASHATKDDFFIQKYKLIDIFSNPPSKYVELIKKYGVTETTNLLTVWDTFSHETPGEARRIEMDGKNISDVYDELVKLGLYDAKIIDG